MHQCRFVQERGVGKGDLWTVCVVKNRVYWKENKERIYIHKKEQEWPICIQTVLARRRMYVQRRAEILCVLSICYIYRWQNRRMDKGQGCGSTVKKSRPALLSCRDDLNQRLDCGVLGNSSPHSSAPVHNLCWKLLEYWSPARASVIAIQIGRRENKKSSSCILRRVDVCSLTHIMYRLPCVPCFCAS